MQNNDGTASEVQQMTAAIKQEIEKEYERLYELSRYERGLRDRGIQLICGIDEAGRGPLAGPVTAAAVILPPDCLICGIDDSKKLSAERKNRLTKHFFLFSFIGQAACQRQAFRHRNSQ